MSIALRFARHWLPMLLLVLGTAAPAVAAEDRPDVPTGLASSKRGEIGLMHLGSAVIPPRNTFSVLATLDYWQMSDFFAQGLDQQRMENAGNFSIALADFMELYINGSSTSHLLDDTILDDQILAQSIGDFLIGTKWGLRANHWLWLAADLSAQFRTEQGGIGPKMDATGISTRMLFTADLTASDLKKPVRFNLNLGFVKDNAHKLVGDDQFNIDPVARYALGIPYDDQAFVGGVSVEFPQEFYNVFLEYSTEQYVDMNESQPDYLPGRTFITNPQRFTPGIRIFPVAGMHIDASVDLGHNLFMSGARYDIRGLGLLHKIEPDWVAHLGVGYVFYPPKPELPKEGRVWGVIYDGRDRKPLKGARITFPGTQLTTLVTGADGKYRSYQFPEGKVRVRIDKESFQSVETDVTIAAGDEVRQDFVLKYVEQVGELIGQITDPRGEPIAGQIAFKEEVDTITADPQTGQFQLKLEPGIYTLKAMATGYQDNLKRVRIADQRRTVVNFVLQPAKIVGTLKGQVVDQEGSPVGAVMRFNEPSISPVNVDPASGAYEAELPPGEYVVKAFAPGYETAEKPFRIAQDEITVVDFTLEEASQTGKVMGKVVNAKTKEGIYAVVSFPGGEHSNVPTDPDSGSFVVELPEGSYQIKAANQNFKSATVNARVEKGKETRLTFELKPYEKVRVTDDQVEIKDKIRFTTGKATIKIESYPILDEIAQVMKELPDMEMIVEGHTDSVGDETVNKRLSQKRAEAVRDYLISRGVRADRLEAVGYGEEDPVADNRTEEGRAKNRRVEFKIKK